MGADLILAITEAPRWDTGERILEFDDTIENEVRSRLKAVPDVIVEHIAETSGAGADERTDDGDDIDQLREAVNDFVVRAMKELLEGVAGPDFRRDVQYQVLNEVPYFMAGCMSWGDVEEAHDLIWAIAETGVTRFPWRSQ